MKREKYGMQDIARSMREWFPQLEADVIRSERPVDSMDVLLREAKRAVVERDERVLRDAFVFLEQILDHMGLYENEVLNAVGDRFLAPFVAWDADKRSGDVFPMPERLRSYHGGHRRSFPSVIRVMPRAR